VCTNSVVYQKSRLERLYSTNQKIRPVDQSTTWLTASWFVGINPRDSCTDLGLREKFAQAHNRRMRQRVLKMSADWRRVTAKSTVLNNAALLLIDATSNCHAKHVRITCRHGHACDTIDARILTECRCRSAPSRAILRVRTYSSIDSSNWYIAAAAPHRAGHHDWLVVVVVCVGLRGRRLSARCVTDSYQA